MGLFAGVNGLITAGKQNKLAKAINPVNADYTVDPNVSGLYSEGRNLYQGRMAGATAAEQGISTDEANATAFAENNATDASQLLSFGASVYGKGNDARVDLAQKEAQDKVGRFGVYSNVTELLNREKDKVFQDKLRKYYDDLNYKRGLEGAALQNKASFFQGLDDTVNTAVSLFTGGLAGGGGSGGGGSTGGQTPSFGQYSQTQTNQFNPNAGASPASSFGNVPFNPARSNNPQGLYQYLNRPR